MNSICSLLGIGNLADSNPGKLFIESKKIAPRSGYNPLVFQRLEPNETAPKLLIWSPQMRNPLKKVTEPMRRWLASRELFGLWFKESKHLFIEVVGFNLFAFLVVYPILQWMFPPLSGWEKFRGFFTGSTRLTYMEIAPITAKVIWIIGNGFLLAMIHRRYSKRHEQNSPANRDQPETLNLPSQPTH